jgi:hypothetical protein
MTLPRAVEDHIIVSSNISCAHAFPIMHLPIFAPLHLHHTIQVLIITNSDEGWVNYSAERFLPNLIPVLKNYRVISARTRYENFYPNQPLCWKAAAFAHEVNEHFCSLEEASAMLERECSRVSTDSVPDIDMVSAGDDSSLSEASISSAECSPGADDVVGFPTSSQALSSPYASKSSLPPKAIVRPIRREIISFGDSMEERTAVKIVSDQLSALPKSVMFVSNPNPSQIIGQLTMLTHHMNFVCEHSQDLDLEITTKQADKCAQHYLSKRGLVQQEKPSIFQRILGAGSFSSLGGSDQPASIDEEMGQFQLC